jgi:hypothetical protein
MSASTINFYLGAATVIPVFFLTLTLQGKQFDAVENLLRKLSQSTERGLKQMETSEKWLKIATKITFFQLSWILIRGLTILVLSVSLLGEVLALLALSNGSDDSATHNLVLIAVVGLTVGIGILLYIRVEILWGANLFGMLRALARFIIRLEKAAKKAQQNEQLELPWDT